MKIVRRMFRRLRRGNESRRLAFRIERLARELAGAPPPTDSRADPLAVLEAAHATLEGLVQARRAITAPAQPQQMVRLPASPTPAPAPRPAAPRTPRSDDAQGGPSAAWSVIRLRDQLAVALRDGRGVGQDVVEMLYRELGALLLLDHVTPLEEEGMFNPKFQEAVEVRPTRDPAQVDRVCHTVRAGYRSGAEVLRPQQVVIYAYENP